MTIAVTATLRGSLLEPTATVRAMGGIVGGAFRRPSTAPSFVVGEEVIVFLKTDDTDHWRVVEGEKGKASVDPSGAITYLGSSLPEATFVALVAATPTSTEGE